MLKTFKRLSIILILIYLASVILLYIKQRDLLYHITSNLPTNYPMLTLENQNEKIRVLILNKGQENVLVYFGGNGQSMVASADSIARRFANFTVYAMEYRGYGKSTGKPTEAGIYADALALYDQIKSFHKNIMIAGRSLGSAVATYVASQREVHKLILITPFDSIENVAKEQYPMYPIALLLHDTYNAKSRVGFIKAQTLILVAQNDKTISRIRTNSLIDSFNPSQLRVAIIKDTGHNTITSSPKYPKILQAFMNTKND